MAEKSEKERRQNALFMNLVLSFQMSAMQQMGKVKNPVSDKIERDLIQARMYIDMLDMLKAKTANNLNEDEDKLLDHITSELKLNYIDEVNKDKEEKDATESEAPAKEETEKQNEKKKEKAGKSKKDSKEKDAEESSPT